MTIHTRSVYGQNRKQLSLSRVLDMPPPVVFEAWTNAGQVSLWWGPYGFTNSHCILEPRPGGRLLIHMQAPDGMIFPVTGIFHQLDRPEKLVFTSSAFADEEGMDQLESLNTVLFQPLSGKTLLVFEALVIRASPEAQEALAEMEESWKQSLEKLASLLEEQRRKE